MKSSEFILTLDGGGVRGLISLLTLRAIMVAVSEWERKKDIESGTTKHTTSYNPDNFRPHKYFTGVYGTSTGGIIAIMIGRLNMTIGECLEAYRKLPPVIFHHRRFISRFIPTATKYGSGGMEEACAQLVEKYSPSSDLLTNLGQKCETICVAAQFDSTTPYFIHSKSLTSTFTIKEAASATSAASTFFEPCHFLKNGKHITLIDGGIRENNPSKAALIDHCDRGLGIPELVLSIGTGQHLQTRDDLSKKPRGGMVGAFCEKWELVKDIITQYTDCEKNHQEMLSLSNGGLLNDYLRLNVRIADRIRLDEWKPCRRIDPATGKRQVVPGGETMLIMENATRAYLDDDIVKKNISRIGEKLVEARRERERLR